MHFRLVLAFCLFGGTAWVQVSPAKPVSLADADRAFLAGRYQDAITVYQSLLASNEKEHAARAGLVRSYLKQEDLKNAELVSSAAPADAEHLSSFLTARGELEFRQARIESAEHTFLQAIQLTSPDARAYLGLATIYDAFSMHARAQLMADRAFALAPEDPDIFHDRLSRLPSARRLLALREFLQKNVGDLEMREDLRQHLDSLQDSGRSVGPGCTMTSKLTSAGAELWPMFAGTEVYGYGLEVKVNGKKSVLQIDTGASGILISRKLANRAGVKRLRSTKISGIGDEGPMPGYVGYAKSLVVAGLEFRNCPVEVADNKKVYDEQGLIGTDVFDEFLITLDFPARRFRLDSLPEPPNLKAERLASLATDGNEELLPKPRDRYIAPTMQHWEKIMRFGHDLLIWTRVNDSEPKLFLLDTGAYSNLVSSEFLETELAKDRHIGGLSGKVKEVRSAKKVDLRFAGFLMHGRDVTAIDLSRLSKSIGTEMSGILGHDVLRQMEISIDYRDGLIHMRYDPARLR